MLLVSNEFYSELKKSIYDSSVSILITSAFIKNRAVIKLLEAVSSEVNVTIVARWRKHDLLMGASDIEVFELCQAKGWKFGIDQNLHGKLYLIDDSDVFLGSANLTQRGMSLGGVANIEFGTRFDVSKIDLKRINHYKRSEVTWIDDDVFSLIKQDIDASLLVKGAFSDLDWSPEIANLISTPVESLWINELMFCNPHELLYLNLNDSSIAHDFELLNLDIDNISVKNIKHNFRQSRLYTWIYSQLSTNKEMNFGALSHALHDSLFDDPLPYRKEIKEFVVLIFSWVVYMDDVFVVTKHNHTSSIKLKNGIIKNG